MLDGGTTDTVVLVHSNVVQITGTGRFRQLGRVGLTSTMDVRSEKPLLRTPWLLHVDVVLSNPEGTVSVRLTPGVIHADPFAMPVHLKYTIQGGTGAYRNVAGTGLADLTLLPGQPSLRQYDQLLGRLKRQGVQFTLYFHQGHPSKWNDFTQFWFNVIQTAVHASPSFRGARAPGDPPPAKHK